ncbi:MAG: patatin-like phospholipase family protein [Mycobacterium sp.]
MTDEVGVDGSGTKIALALGAGGARGYAHIGVIQELRERGYEISGVSGSSMGALVGGLEAAGALDEFTSWATSLTQRAVLRLLDPTWTSPGFFRAEKILDVVRELLGDIAIEDLPIPFTAVATDLIAGKSVWLQRGSLTSAIRASIAIPGMISPHVLDGRVLADGGILDSLAVAPLAGVHAELRVAVSLSGSDDLRAPEPKEPRVTAEWLNRLLRSTSAIFETDTANALRARLGASSQTAEAIGLADEPSEDPATADQPDPSAKLTSFEVMNRTIEVMQSALARMQYAAHPPDVLIEVPRATSRSLDFHRAAEVIEVGRRCAADALDAYAT